MQITRDNLDEMDCVMIQQMLQARTSNDEGEIVKSSAKVVASRKTCKQNKKWISGDRKSARARRTKKQERLLTNRRRKSQSCNQAE